MDTSPRWIRDILRFLPLRSQFVVSGNVRDRFAWFGGAAQLTPLPMAEFLAAHLANAGVQRCLAWAIGEGLRIVPRPGQDLAAERAFYQEHFSLTWPDGADIAPRSTDALFELLQQIARFRDEPVAVIIDPASRLITRPDALSDAEQALFTRAYLFSQRAVPLAAALPDGERKVARFHPIFWIVDREADLPDWFVLGNPRVRGINVPVPDQGTRRSVAAAICRNLPAFTGPETPASAEILRRFVDQTHQMRLNDLLGIVQLCVSENLAYTDLPEGARRYRLGVTEDPWKRIDRARIRDAKKTVARRVIGQERAVTAMLDVVKRAVMGVSGTRRTTRPRGVSFLAGPTGTGKTELAKTVTQLLFGDEDALVRFDMSEFSAQHSDQRLIGAPPGYVGYDSGGELTNAIRERPFSVVLFDEIEKAHPRILDKFLQILDEGVLTSGRGERVYFSEAFVIFTSNLGIHRQLPDGTREANVSPADDYETVAARIRQGIEDYFKLELGRPELLNRLGENILVFDFIRPDQAREIFVGMLARILAELAEDTGVSVELSASATAQLANACLSDLTNGGRGIRNQLDARLLNPLARVLFDEGFGPGDRVQITAVAQEPELPGLTAVRS